MKLRRFSITFLLLVNSAALVLVILTLSNASPLTDVASADVRDTGNLLVVAERDASLAVLLAVLGIAGNLVLGYLFLGNRGEESSRKRAGGPRITGE